MGRQFESSFHLASLVGYWVVLYLRSTSTWAIRYCMWAIITALESSLCLADSSTNSTNVSLSVPSLQETGLAIPKSKSHQQETWGQFNYYSKKTGSEVLVFNKMGRFTVLLLVPSAKKVKQIWMAIRFTWWWAGNEWGTQEGMCRLHSGNQISRCILLEVGF